VKEAEQPLTRAVGGVHEADHVAQEARETVREQQNDSEHTDHAADALRPGKAGDALDFGGQDCHKAVVLTWRV